MCVFCFFYLIVVQINVYKTSLVFQVLTTSNFACFQRGFFIESEQEVRQHFQLLSKMAGTGFLGIIVVGLLAFIGSTHAQLQINFYAKSCPKAEKIVLDYVKEHRPNAPSLAASFIRMHFHDCFVRVCISSDQTSAIFLWFFIVTSYCRMSSRIQGLRMKICISGMWCICASKLHFRPIPRKECCSESNTQGLWFHW